jgi:hypothetical protein
VTLHELLDRAAREYGNKVRCTVTKWVWPPLITGFRVARIAAGIECLWEPADDVVLEGLLRGRPSLCQSERFAAESWVGVAVR